MSMILLLREQFFDMYRYFLFILTFLLQCFRLCFLGWGRQEYRAPEEERWRTDWSFGENGESVGEQRHWWRHCSHSTALQADPEPVRGGERHWGHHILPRRGSAPRRHRSGGLSQGWLWDHKSLVCARWSFTIVFSNSLLCCLSACLLQHVRLLSRKQFQLRALMQKARKTAGLSDLYWPHATGTPFPFCLYSVP